MMTGVEFADLDRSFVRVGAEEEPLLNMGPMWGRKIGGWLDWTDLLQHRRVVLLAEASSGKSAEFRGRTAALHAAGRAAFFVTIEQLSDLGLQVGLGPAESRALQEWRTGSDPGWFFLDSVDEARLNRRSFDSALKRFASELGVEALGRAYVLVSCRVTDWKAPEDPRSIKALLPYSEQASDIECPPDFEAALLRPVFEQNRIPWKTPSSKPGQPNSGELLIVRLVPLADEQRRKLAAGCGIADADALVASIGRQGLETLAERPGDLLELAEYWKTYGRFGTLAEMTEHGVVRMLRERDRFRPDNDALPAAKAREGARRLSATLTLAKSFTVRAPGHEPDPTLAAGALEPADVLDDWTDAERNALLRRGLFAPSTYGRIRFHHRSAQEYLTAEWINHLLEAGCPLRELSGLLFGEPYGVETVVPSLRPEAAWLALRSADIREEILLREPLILLRGGDPGTLPIATKERLLAAFASKHAAGEIADDNLDHRALWMFADQALAGAIRGAWHLNERADFRVFLLRLIREGGIAACVDLARDVITDAAGNDYHRIVALEALEASGDQEGLARVATMLLEEPARESARLASAFAKILFPQHLTAAQLLQVADKSKPPREGVVEGFGQTIGPLWTACSSAPARQELIAGLANLCLRPPFGPRHRQISERHSDLARHLSPIAHDAVASLGDRDPPESLLRLLMVVERAGSDDWSSEVDSGVALAPLVRANSRIQRGLFWRDVDAQRQHRGDQNDLNRYWQVHFDGTPLWVLDAPDLPWLYEDLSGRARADRQVALSAIVDILRRTGRLDDQIPALRATISGDPLLTTDLNGYLAPPLEDDHLTLQVRQEREQAKREREEQEGRAKQSWINLRADLQRNPSRLTDPTELATPAGFLPLMHLTRWLQCRTGKDAKDAALQWRVLEEGFGLTIADAYRHGVKTLWRVVEPERPRRTKGSGMTIKWTTILSFAGVGLEAADAPGWVARLSDAEAQRAARHGCFAEQGFPTWIEDLAVAHPQAVVPCIRANLRLEWSSRERSRDFLNRYGNPNEPLPPLIEPVLYEIITGREPADLNALDRGLRVLQRMAFDNHRRRSLATFGRRRFRKHISAGRCGQALRYLALLFFVDDEGAVERLLGWLSTSETHKRAALAEWAFGSLFGRTDPLAAAALKRASVHVLQELVLRAYQHVKPEEDSRHEGSYTPDARDDAEEGRNRVLSALLDKPCAGGYAAVRRLADHPDLRASAHRLRELARGMAERAAEIPSWNVDDVLDLERRHTAPIKSGADLLRVASGVLDEVRSDLAGADASSRRVVETAVDESAVQTWLAEQMRLRGKGRFHLHREAEVAAGDLPDIIVSSTSGSEEVAIEVKRSEMWTVRQLEMCLRRQLAERYLKPASRRHGILVLTHQRRRTWRHPLTRAPMEFASLTTHLCTVAAQVMTNSSGPVTLLVRGIDATEQLEAARRARRLDGAGESGPPRPPEDFASLVSGRLASTQ